MTVFFPSPHDNDGMLAHFTDYRGVCVCASLCVCLSIARANRRGRTGTEPRSVLFSFLFSLFFFFADPIEVICVIPGLFWPWREYFSVVRDSHPKCSSFFIFYFTVNKYIIELNWETVVPWSAEHGDSAESNRPLLYSGSLLRRVAWSR